MSPSQSPSNSPSMSPSMSLSSSPSLSPSIAPIPVNIRYAGPKGGAVFTNVDSVGTIDWADNGGSTDLEGAKYYNDSTQDKITLQVSEVSHYLQATGFGFTIPTGATIRGISVGVFKSVESGSVSCTSVQLVKSGTIVGDNKAQGDWSSNYYSQYGDEESLWGSAWTVDDVNDPDFGFAISVTNTGAGESVASIDYIEIIIYYSVSIAYDEFVTPKFEFQLDFNDQLDAVTWRRNLTRNFLQIDSLLPFNEIGHLGERVSINKLVCYKDGAWYAARAISGEYSRNIAMTIMSGELHDEVRLRRGGQISSESWNTPSGELLYLSKTLSGEFTTTPPFPRIPVGYAVGGNRIVLFATLDDTFGDTDSDNVGIGTKNFGTSGEHVLAIHNGTEPTSSPADQIEIYSVDITAGNASLGLRTEKAVVSDVGLSSTHSLTIRVNGSTYKIPLIGV